MTTKTYHNQYPGSTFYMPDGRVFSFNAIGILETDDADLQRELDKIADKPGCPIFTKEQMTRAPGDDLPVQDIQNKAAQTVAALKAAAQPKG